MRYAAVKKNNPISCIKKYLYWVLASMRAQFAYKGVIWENIFSYTVRLGLMLLLWKAIYNQSDMIYNRTYRQMAQYLVIGNTISSFYIYPSIHFLASDIRKGDIAYLLLKPIDFQAMFIFKNVGRIIAVAATIFPFFLILMSVIGIREVQGNYVFTLLSTVTSILTCVSLDFFLGILCFWTENSWGISFTRQVMIQYLSGAFIPFEFFPEYIMVLLRDYLPFSGIVYAPVQFLTAPCSMNGFICRTLIQIAWCVFFIMVGRFIYHKARMQTVINGG